MILPVGPRDEIPSQGGQPVFLQDYPGELVSVASDLWAVRVTRAEASRLGYLAAPRELKNKLVDAAVALLRNRERVRFDPADGSELVYREHGIAYGASGRAIFPRLDPAVIGIVELADQHRILLGINARRHRRFSLIAGYVSHGETLEEAFAREAMEETARRVTEISYVSSQPWPVTGSIMVGMRGITVDEEPRAATDGELSETIWASAADILEQKIPIVPPGSIAHEMIVNWAREKQEADCSD